MIIRDTVETDLDSLLKANAVEVTQSSAMDAGRVQALHKLTRYDNITLYNNMLTGFFIVSHEDDQYG